MGRLTRKKFTFKVTHDELENYLSIIKEMNKISNAHKIKWVEDGVLIYSIKGEDGEEKSQGKINLLKTFFLKRDMVFKNFPSDINITYTIREAKKYHDKYSLILDEKLDEYDIEFSFVEEYDVVELFKAVGDMYKSLTAVAGDDTLIKDFDPNTLKDRLDPEMSDNKFELSVDMIKRLLKAIKLEPDNDLIDLTITNGEVVFSESQYELKVAYDETLENCELCFKKEYLKSIICHPEFDSVTVSIFPSYIAIDEHKSYMMCTLSL